jgi:cation diffusion facilitator family transporter
MATPSRQSIYAALIGNIAVAAAKLAAFAFSGSSSMLVESFHSGIDTINQGLLIFGQIRAARPADARHPFGYGLEAYFWTFVVALLILLAGGIASIYEGLEKLLHPAPMKHVAISLTTLAVCTVVEVASLVVSVRAAEKGRSNQSRRRIPRPSLAEWIHYSPDPAVFEVLAEDAASILGLGIAFLGIIGDAWFGWRLADGIAAATIGILLVALAGVVISETYSLVTGESALPSTLDTVRNVLQKECRVAAAGDLRSMQFGPDSILLAATLQFHKDLPLSEVEAVTSGLTRKLKDVDPRIGQVFLRAKPPSVHSGVPGSF